MEKRVVLRAEVRTGPVWSPSGDCLDPTELPLSERLLAALDDWVSFYDDVGGEIGDPDVAEEFVGQGFKIAHAMRRELKGWQVAFQHPLTDDLIEIEGQRGRRATS